MSLTSCAHGIGFDKPCKECPPDGRRLPDGWVEPSLVPAPPVWLSPLLDVLDEIEGSLRRIADALEEKK